MRDKSPFYTFNPKDRRSVDNHKARIALAAVKEGKPKRRIELIEERLLEIEKALDILNKKLS